MPHSFFTDETAGSDWYGFRPAVEWWPRGRKKMKQRVHRDHATWKNNAAACHVEGKCGGLIVVPRGKKVWLWLVNVTPRVEGDCVQY